MKGKSHIHIIGCFNFSSKFCHAYATTLAFIHSLSHYYSATLYASAFSHHDKRESSEKAFTITTLPIPSWFSWLFDSISLLIAAVRGDIVLIRSTNCIWLLPLLRAFTRTIFLVHIANLYVRKSRKGLFHYLRVRRKEKTICKYAHKVLIHDQAVGQYLKETYQINPVWVPSGGDHILDDNSVAVDGEYPELVGEYIFSECFVYPGSQAEVLLKTFAQFPKYQLVLLGDWGKSAYGKNLYKHYSAYDNIKLFSPTLKDDVRSNLKKNAFLYIHADSSPQGEIGLLEAMTIGLPVISYDTAANRSNTDNLAFYFIHQSQIIDILEVIHPSLLAEKAAAMSDIASSRFTWDHVAIHYSSIIAKLLKPTFTPKVAEEALSSNRASG